MIEVMLAKKHTGQDPTGWWMSEKLDGVRAVWTGEAFISRNGNPFFAPEWFTRDLPKLPLDGELWEGRGEFQSTVSSVRKHKGDWSKVTFQVFDIINTDTFEERYATLRDLDLPFHVEVVTQVSCRDELHMCEFEGLMESVGGEGIMLRAPGSLYEHKRSSALLKVKKFHTDEAVITGYEPGKGRHEGRLGAVTAEWNGHKFKIGSGFSDAQRETPPAIGTVVTFQYFETTKAGIPRFPTFLTARDYE